MRSRNLLRFISFVVCFVCVISATMPAKNTTNIIAKKTTNIGTKHTNTVIGKTTNINAIKNITNIGQNISSSTSKSSKNARQAQYPQYIDVNEIVVEEKTTGKPVMAKSRQISSNEELICPGNDTQVPLFTLPCQRNSDCSILGPGLACCERKEVLFKRCLKGVPAPKPEPPHKPWLRLIPRKCPESPIAEFRSIKNCTTDDDCSPRICCPEKGGGVNYCRTAAFNLDNFPGVKRMLDPVISLTQYFQCTAPPSALLDLFPRECSSMLDCFPNLCCQEQGRRVCRPPRQSIFALIAGLSRRVASSSAQTTANLINRN